MAVSGFRWFQSRYRFHITFYQEILLFFDFSILSLSLSPISYELYCFWISLIFRSSSPPSPNSIKNCRSHHCKNQRVDPYNDTKPLVTCDDVHRLPHHHEDCTLHKEGEEHAHTQKGTTQHFWKDEKTYSWDDSHRGLHSRETTPAGSWDSC